MLAHRPHTPADAALHEAARNVVMASLPSDVLDRVWQDAARVRLMHGQVLARAGEAVDRVLFVIDGLVCLIADNAGKGPHLAMVGRDGGVGLMELCMRRKTMFAAAVVQNGGLALSLRVDHVHALIDGIEFGAAAMTSVHDLMSQIMENSASNACDTVMERCARWLLMAHDRLGSGDVVITHGALADLLGVRRSGVTVAISTLLQRGLIETRRGRITLSDPGQLRLLAGRMAGPIPGLPPSPD